MEIGFLCFCLSQSWMSSLKAKKPPKKLKYLFKKREVAAALSEAQQQREDVNGAGCLARARPGRVSLGHTELLGHWSEKSTVFSS